VSINDQVSIEYAGLRALFGVLRANGYQLVGPRLRDGVIIYDELASIDELPAGWTDEQEAGKYRPRKRKNGAPFGYAVGSHSWKKFLFLQGATVARSGQAFHGPDSCTRCTS